MDIFTGMDFLRTESDSRNHGRNLILGAEFLVASRQAACRHGHDKQFL